MTRVRGYWCDDDAFPELGRRRFSACCGAYYVLPETILTPLHVEGKLKEPGGGTCHPFLSHPFPSVRQHPSYGDCLEVKREYYQNSSVLDCVTQCSQSAAHLYEQFLHVQQTGFVTLGHLRSCPELYYCNMVEWFWWDASLILTTNWFPSVL